MAAAELQAAWVSRVLGLDVAGGEPIEDVLGDAYRPVLLRQLKRLKSSGVGAFGIVLGRHGLEHRLLVMPNRSPHGLAARLMQQTGLPAMTWGQVVPHPNRPATLQLSVEGRVLPGLARRGERMLRAFRPLPFSRIVLHQGGAAVPDGEDDADEDGDDPGGTLPPPQPGTPQSDALRRAARSHAPFCEECARRRG